MRGTTEVGEHAIDFHVVEFPVFMIGVEFIVKKQILILISPRIWVNLESFLMGNFK